MRTRKLQTEAEMASVADRQSMPEKTRYTRYYEHDGMLRAYANRSMVLAMVFGAIALSSLAFAVYVRLQPPTVIRVDSEGDATVVAGTPVPGHSRGLSFVASAAEAAPTDVEAKAVVRRFLDRYLNLTPATVDRQMADALNMMTGNFKALVLGRLREDDTINKIQDDHIVTNFTIRTIAMVQGSPLTFTAFGFTNDPYFSGQYACFRSYGHALSPQEIVAPLPVISQPANGSSYQPGAVINFAGSAVDFMNRPLGAADLTWQISYAQYGQTNVVLTR